jgi:hypothetical protein
VPRRVIVDHGGHLAVGALVDDDDEARPTRPIEECCQATRERRPPTGRGDRHRDIDDLVHRGDCDVAAVF